MHDPMTVAWELRRPWPAPRTHAGPRYWPAIVTMWHCDPEAGGDDDSCGFSFVPLTKSDREWAEKQAPRFWKERFGYPSIDLTSASNLEILISVWCEVRVGYTRKRPGYIYRPLPRRDWNAVVNVCISPCDNIASLIERSRAFGDAGIEGMVNLLMCVIRLQKTLYRPWYRKPKWHVHHWKVQIHALQNLKRWLFTRCSICAKRFPWGYAPVSDGWGSKGPRWFRGETGKRHHDCEPLQASQASR